MIILGFVLFALAVAAAIVLIAQNHSDIINVHVFNQTWSMHLYWFLVIGLIVAAVGLIGVAMMRAGAAHAGKVRRERRLLARENDRLAGELDAERAERQRQQEVAMQSAPVANAESGPVADGPVGRSDEAPVRHRLVRHRTV